MATKPSATLRYLEHHPVFTLDEYLGAVDPSVSEATRYANLRNAVARGQARRLTRRLYASSIGVYGRQTPRVALVASKAAPDAVLAYHTALDAHGVGHSAFRRALFVSDRRAMLFTVDGYRFERVAPPKALRERADPAAFTQLVRVGDDLVRATTPERTLVDCLVRLDLGGGLEEVLRSVGGYPNIDSRAVVEYVTALDSPSAAARAGWLLELSRDAWHVAGDDLAALRALVGRGPYRLAADPAGAPHFVSSWRLYVPADKPYEMWLRS